MRVAVDSTAAELEPFLRPDDKLLWTGRPDPSRHFTAADALLIPFSLLWGGFAVFWESAVVADGAPLLFLIWGIPFVCFGLYLTVGRFFWKARQKRRTTYGLTAYRAIVVVGGRSMSDAPVGLSPTTLELTRDGRHVSVTFGAGSGPWAPGRWSSRFLSNTGWPAWGWAVPVGFYDVADVEGLRAALAQAGRV